MREGPAPVVADDLRAEDDVAERARHSLRQLVASVDRERQDVGRLVDAEMIPFQPAHLVRADERDPELTAVDPLGAQDPLRELAHARLVHDQAAPVLELDGNHLFCSSVCSLYASTMRCTSL